MGELTTDDSSRITPSRSSSRATDSSAGRGCVAFSASGESAGAAGSHGGGFVSADAVAWRFASRRRRTAVTPGIQGVLFLFPAFRPAVRLDSFVRLLRTMTFCAAKGTPQIFPASVLRSRQESNATVKAVFDATLQLGIGLQEGVQSRLILPNKRTDTTVLMPIDLIREKLPDRNQKKTGFRLHF